MSGTRIARVAAAAGLLMAVACGSANETRASNAARPAAPKPSALATTTVAGLRIAILEVVRVGDSTLEVRFTATNTATDGAPVDLASHLASAQDDRGTVADVCLVDAASRKKYFVIRDARGRPACSQSVHPIAPGETRSLWARFLAPPLRVSRIGVQFALEASPVDVPISQAPPAVGSEPPRRAPRM